MTSFSGAPRHAPPTAPVEVGAGKDFWSRVRSSLILPGPAVLSRT